MTVVLDWNTDDWTVPEPPVSCSMCGEQASPPFVHWRCWGADDEYGVAGHIIICTDCCHWSRRGLTADMMRADAIQEGLRKMKARPSLDDHRGH